MDRDSCRQVPLQNICEKAAMAAGKTIKNKSNKPSPAHPESTDIFALIGRSENIEQAAVAMQAMSHPARIKILCILSSGEQMVQDLTSAIGTTQSNISQHLGILKGCGMIASRKEATKTYYSIEDPRILKMISLTRDIFCGV
jgi:ArsR family transcriptional regulator